MNTHFSGFVEIEFILCGSLLRDPNTILGVVVVKLVLRIVLIKTLDPNKALGWEISDIAWALYACLRVYATALGSSYIYDMLFIIYLINSMCNH